MNQSAKACSASSPYIAGFDYLRIAAAFAVVWIHGSDTNRFAMRLQDYCSFAVPSFILMSVFLSTQSFARKKGLGLRTFLVLRAKRLIPAYVGWSLVYLFFRYLKHRFITGIPLELDWISVIFFGGASYQLWFVPMLLMWSLVFGVLMCYIARAGHKRALGGLLILAGVLLYGTGPEMARHLSLPPGYEMLKYGITDTGFVLLGMGLWALLKGAEGIRLPSANPGYVVMGVAGIGLSLAGMRTGFNRALFMPLFTLSTFWLSLRPGGTRGSAFVRYLSPVAFGIYLCHAIFVEGLQVAMGLAGINIGSFEKTAGLIISAFVMSSILCIVLRRWRFTEWLVV